MDKKEIVNSAELLKRLRDGDKPDDLAVIVADEVNVVIGEYKRELNAALFKEKKLKYVNTVIFKALLDYISEFYPVEYDDGVFDSLFNLEDEEFLNLFEKSFITPSIKKKKNKDTFCLPADDEWGF